MLPRPRYSEMSGSAANRLAADRAACQGWGRTADATCLYQPAAALVLLTDVPTSTLLRNMGESSTVGNVGARSRVRGGLADGGEAALGPSGTETSSLPATLLVSDAVRDPKMLLRPRLDPSFSI